MNADKIANIIGGIVTLAIITTLVARPNTVKVIAAFGEAFRGAVYAGLGAGVDFK